MLCGNGNDSGKRRKVGEAVAREEEEGKGEEGKDSKCKVLESIFIMEL